MLMKEGFQTGQNGRPGCESRSHIHPLGAGPGLSQVFDVVKVAQKRPERKTGKF